MIRYFIKAFKITNENIILTTPLVLFLFLFSIYLGVAQNAPATTISAILLLITIVLMFSAFFAGWFFMVRKAVELNKKEFIIDDDKSRASFELMKEIPIGVGEYFLSFLGAAFLYFGLFVFVSFIAYQVGMHFIGKVDLDLRVLKLALESSAAMKAFISSLSPQQLVKLNAWYLMVLSCMTIFSFLTMFWAAEIIFKTKNAFVAFFKALFFTLKNFLSAIILFIYVSAVNIIVSIINALGTINPILYFISMLVYFYFIVYVIVLIFLYYDEAHSDKTKSDSDSGTDSIRQEQSGDTESFGE